MLPGRRRSVIFVTVLGVCLVAIAVTLNVGWVLINWKRGVLAVLGLVFFLVIIAGMVLNTIFLVREIRRNEQHDSFINAVTHELKTPVASIRLYLQTLQKRDMDDAKRREFYEAMLADSDRLLHTIEQVLRAGSTLSQFRRIAQARIDLADIVQECVALALTRFHLTAGAVSFDNRTASAAAVVGDADELKAAVFNLIDNAVKYSTGPPSISISLQETADMSRLALKVADRGAGISPHELKRVFRRFYRIHGMSVRAKGSGLGLFIVRSVAKRHGGKAFAESDGPGRGSTFTLLLPRAPDVA
ncbi:MAG TPA: HAMP domain-containing sensor histidine kinase [Vicinamibacterales bacterium]|nr:HAMP domain-containing sensor histidine kinase [Vicinamibacterales bacterium]